MQKMNTSHCVLQMECRFKERYYQKVRAPQIFKFDLALLTATMYVYVLYKIEHILIFIHSNSEAKGRLPIDTGMWSRKDITSPERVTYNPRL